MENKAKRKAYLFIASSFLVYLGAYVVRNILGSVSPQCIEENVFTEGIIGNFSSILFIFYGIGQLVNGFLGEKFPPKTMIAVGLTTGALCTVGFALVDVLAVRYVLWAITGLAMSMLYGPLVKGLTAHLPPETARMGYLLLIVSTIFGSTVSGLIAGWCESWVTAFIVGAVVLFLPLLFYRYMIARMPDVVVEAKAGEEKKPAEPFSLKKFMSVFGGVTIVFLCLNCCTNATRQAISFWSSTFIADHLGYDSHTSAIIFGIIAAVKAVVPFLSLPMYKLFRKNERLAILVLCFVASCCFGGLLVSENNLLSMILLGVGQMLVDLSATMVGSYFLLDFAKFGCISAISGVYDGASYLVAAVCSKVFSSLLTKYGWNSVMIFWTVLPLVAVVLMAFVLDKKKYYIQQKTQKNP